MKVQVNLHAGMTYEECDAQRNWYKGMVQSGKCGGYYPIPPVPPAPTPQPPSGGYVGGVYYPDLSGVCG